MRKQHGNIAIFVVLVLVVGLVLVIWLQRLAIYDWWQLRGYTPPAAIAELASDTTMTSIARHDFYVNHPDLEGQTQFNQNCPAGTEQTVVLGCYHPNQQGIFLYTVNDPQLHGVEQVTAAHEMLHAAYDRLSTKERNYVDGLLESYYKNDVHDPQMLSTIAAYQKSEPNAVVNEMHSVFGTEVANLPPPLETYYKQYFTDRSKITDYYASYQAAFVSRQNQVAADDAKLSQLKSEFTTDETDLQSKQTELTNLQAELHDDQAQANISAYNTEVPDYNAKVNAFNAEIDVTKQLIDQYNQLVNSRNAIALEEQQLDQAINSHYQPATTQ